MRTRKLHPAISRCRTESRVQIVRRSSHHAMFLRWLTVVGFMLLRVSANDITFYSKCGTPTGEVTAVRVSNCDSSPCLLVKGQEEYVEIEFKPKYDTPTLTVKVSAILMLEIPWTAMNPDACQGIQSCPLKGGQTYTFKAHMPVQSIYPAISVTVKLQLTDSENRLVTCVTIPMKIVNQGSQSAQSSSEVQQPGPQATPPVLPGQAPPALPGQAPPAFLGTTTSTVPASLFTTATVASLLSNQNIPSAPVNNQNNISAVPASPQNSPPPSPENATAAASEHTKEDCNAATTMYSYSSILFYSLITALSILQL